MSEALIVLALVFLHEVGKAGTHALRSADWAREEMIPGLPISDFFHALSGSMWLLVLWTCWSTWGPDPLYWALAIVGWGTIWPISKLFKPVGGHTLTLREAFNETFYMQIARFLFRRV